MITPKNMLLLISVSLVAGCGSDTEGSMPDEGQVGGNEGKAFDQSAFVRQEWYDADGELTSCQRNQLDGDGYLLSSTFSNVSHDENQPVTCSDTDVNRTDIEYIYSADRSEFITQTQSTYAPNVTCQKTVLSTAGVAVRTETYTSGSNNYSCSVQDGQLFSLLLSSLMEDYYPTEETYYSGAGVDEEWETSDDVIVIRYASTWSVDRLTQTTLSYGLSGADMVWGTEDDWLNAIIETNYKEDKVPDFSFSRMPGVDGLPNTDDDIVIMYTKYRYENNRIKSYTSYISPGADNEWETTEDNMKSMSVFY